MLSDSEWSCSYFTCDIQPSGNSSSLDFFWATCFKLAVISWGWLGLWPYASATLDYLRSQHKTRQVLLAAPTYPQSHPFHCGPSFESRCAVDCLNTRICWILRRVVDSVSEQTRGRRLPYLTPGTRAAAGASSDSEAAARPLRERGIESVVN